MQSSSPSKNTPKPLRLVKVTMAASPVDFMNAPKTEPRRPTPELGEQTEALLFDPACLPWSRACA